MQLYLRRPDRVTSHVLKVLILIIKTTIGLDALKKLQFNSNFVWYYGLFSSSTVCDFIFPKHVYVIYIRTYNMYQTKQVQTGT